MFIIKPLFVARALPENIRELEPRNICDTLSVAIHPPPSLSLVATNDPNSLNYVYYYTYLSNITTRKKRPRTKNIEFFLLSFVNDCQSNVRYILGISLNNK